MSIALRVLPVVALLIGTSGSWAYDDAVSLREQDPACSSLCRSWMSLGHGDGEPVAVPRAAPETPDVPPMTAALPARPTPAPPVVKPAKAGTVASHRVVPPVRPRPDAKRQPAAVAAASHHPLSVAALMPVRTVPAVTTPAIQPAPPEAKLPVVPVRTAPVVTTPATQPVPPEAKLSVVPVPTVPVVTAPAIQPTLFEAQLPMVPAAAQPSPSSIIAETHREAAVEIARSSSSEPVEATLTAQRLTPPTSTPLSVKAAIYLVLAAFALWGFRSRPASRGTDGEAPPSKVRGTVPHRSAAPSIGRLATARD